MEAVVCRALEEGILEVRLNRPERLNALDAGLIDELEARPSDDDPRRRYYRIQPAGLDVARLESARLERAVKMARQKRLTPKKA